MDLLSIQINNVKKLSRDATRTTANDVSIKAQLAASNHPCWYFVTVPGTSRKNNKWHIRCTKKKNKNDFNGKRIRSSRPFAKLSAEIELFQFCSSHEPKLNRKVVLDQLQKMIAPVTPEMNKSHAATFFLCHIFLLRVKKQKMKAQLTSPTMLDLKANE